MQYRYLELPQLYIKNICTSLHCGEARKINAEKTSGKMLETTQRVEKGCKTQKVARILEHSSPALGMAAMAWLSPPEPKSLTLQGGFLQAVPGLC